MLSHSWVPVGQSVPGTHRVSWVQGIVFAFGKDLHQLEDLIVDLSHLVPQNVPTHSAQLNLLQLQKLNSSFIKVLAEGENKTP